MYVCIRTFYTHPSTYLPIHPLIYLSIYLSICLSIYLSIYLSLCVCVCVCTYIYIYIYTSIHTYIHTYICMYKSHISIHPTGLVCPTLDPRPQWGLTVPSYTPQNTPTEPPEPRLSNPEEDIHFGSIMLGTVCVSFLFVFWRRGGWGGMLLRNHQTLNAKEPKPQTLESISIFRNRILSNPLRNSSEAPGMAGIGNFICSPQNPINPQNSSSPP